MSIVLKPHAEMKVVRRLGLQLRAVLSATRRRSP